MSMTSEACIGESCKQGQREMPQGRVNIYQQNKGITKIQAGKRGKRATWKQNTEKKR